MDQAEGEGDGVFEETGFREMKEKLNAKSAKSAKGGGRRRVNRAMFPRRAHKCKGCGFLISVESNYCGECLCEEDGL